MSNVQKIHTLLRLFLVAAMITVALVLYPVLPEQIPTHWNFQGEVDGWSGKLFGVWFIPGLTMVLALLFPLLTKLDPKRDQFKKFETAWEILQTGLVAFFAYLYGAMLVVILRGGTLNPWMWTGFGLLFLFIGWLLPFFKQNYTVGIRLSWTIENEQVWDKTHRLGRWSFMAGGIIFLINAWFDWQPGWVFFLALLVAVVVPIVGAYVFFRQLPKK